MNALPATYVTTCQIAAVNPYESPRERSHPPPTRRRSAYWIAWFAVVFMFGIVLGFFAGYSLGLHDGTVQGMEDLRHWASE